MNKNLKIFFLATLLYSLFFILYSTPAFAQSCSSWGSSDVTCSYSISAPSGQYISSLTGSINDGGSGALGVFCLSGSNVSTKCDVVTGYTSKSISGGSGYTSGEMSVYGSTLTAGISANFGTEIENPTTCPPGTVGTYPDNCVIASCPSGTTGTPPNCTIVGPGCSVSNPGAPCTSAPNSCGQVSNGVIQCDGKCSANTPSNNSCPSGGGGSGSGRTAFGPQNPDLVMQICPEGVRAPCQQGIEVPVNQSQRLRAWYSQDRGRNWADITSDAWWNLNNESSNANQQEHYEFDYNNSCRAGYCLTGRGVRFEPVDQISIPSGSNKGVFKGIVTNYRDCLRSGSGCPSLGAGYSGTSGYIIFRVTEPVSPQCAAGDNVGNTCTSAPNSCGMVNTGTIQCNGSCSAVAPDNNQCKSISGKVFNDNNRNGSLDSSETGVANMTISLRDRADTANLMPPQTTNGSGNYSFTGISQSEYRIKWNAPFGWAATNDSSRPINDPGVSIWNFGGIVNSFTLTVSINSGSGTVTGNGINCPGDCSESYSPNTSVTLTATPATGFGFSNWTAGSGNICNGQGGTCTATIDNNKNAFANFTAVSFNYSLSNSGNSTVTKTSSNAFTQNTITETLTAGAAQPVVLALSGVPSGISYSITPSFCSPNCTSVITFTVSPSAPVGTHSITVTGAPLGRQTNFNLIVNASPITVSCLASPSPALVGQTVRWTGTVSGGRAPFTYSWSGTNIPNNPAPATNPYSRSYSTTGAKIATLTVRDSDGVQSGCPTSTVQINFNPNFEEF